MNEGQVALTFLGVAKMDDLELIKSRLRLLSHALDKRDIKAVRQLMSNINSDAESLEDTDYKDFLYSLASVLWNFHCL